MLHYALNSDYINNSDYMDLYNLSLMLLELPDRDVFLKVHIYLHMVQCISALVQSWICCLWTFSIVFRS